MLYGGTSSAVWRDYQCCMEGLPVLYGGTTSAVWRDYQCCMECGQCAAPFLCFLFLLAIDCCVLLPVLQLILSVFAVGDDAWLHSSLGSPSCIPLVGSRVCEKAEVSDMNVTLGGQPHDGLNAFVTMVILDMVTLVVQQPSCAVLCLA